MYVVESDTIQISPVTIAEIEIVPDESPEDPREWGSLGTIEVCDTASQFRAAAEKFFGKRHNEAIDCLVRGGVFWVGRTPTPWLGLERYRHSGDVYAVCGAGNFPDRQWDVSSIVGFWSPNRDADRDLLKTVRGFRRSGVYLEARKRLVERATADLETFNDWVNGNVYGWKVRVLKEGTEVAEDTCWGYYSTDAAMSDAKSFVQSHQEAGTCPPPPPQ